MSVERICEYCGAELRGKEPYCPKCGTYDQSLIDEKSRFSVIRPQSIEELKLYCREHGIPLSMLDHSVEEDIEEAPMNGIFRDGRRVIVYENAPSGERFILYSGEDEARAAGIYFSRLIDACHDAGIFPERMAGLSDPGSYRLEDERIEKTNLHWSGLLSVLLVGAVIVTAVLVLARAVAHRGDGYYTFNGNYYYKDGYNWYIDSELGWIKLDTADYEEDTKEFLGETYLPDWPITEFSQPEDVDSPDELFDDEEDDPLENEALTQN
ncbi:MAG: hypothetical protein IKZ82_02760 [Clostridia bacterium]|nr:hypothetical protein [Clostridia bacterium]